MSNKILVTGANGQLGTELKKLLPNAFFADVDVLDITDADAVKKFVTNNQIETIIKVVHISTDYVFDGTNHKPYLPEDKANPVSVYGKTKRAGELAVLDNASVAVVIRTAWLYSAYGNNFVKTMRRLGAERESLNVVADQIGSPTFAGDLAQAIVTILPQMNETNKGIYHYTNEGVCIVVNSFVS